MLARTLGPLRAKPGDCTGHVGRALQASGQLQQRVQQRRRLEHASWAPPLACDQPQQSSATIVRRVHTKEVTRLTHGQLRPRRCLPRESVLGLASA